MDVLAGGRPPSPGGFGKFRRGGAHSSMSVCPNDRQCNGGEGKEMEPGSEKVRRSLPSHSEPSLPSHVRPSSAKSSCSLHKTDSADDDSLPPIRILISPPSLSPPVAVPLPFALGHSASHFPLSFSPLSGLRSVVGPPVYSHNPIGS